DPIVGTQYRDLLPLFEADEETEAVVLVGEIGGDEEENTAAYIKDNISKPCFAFIVGRTAPKGKRMGHAGAIISGSAGTAESKTEAFNAADVPVAKTIDEVAEMVKDKFGG
ncbi:MAG: succinate--CoA ligase subunit alpha, partial [Verrucomicrobiota bacterium]